MNFIFIGLPGPPGESGLPGLKGKPIGDMGIKEILISILLLISRRTWFPRC
jgi:hypothetical protein